jgi:hypothetical protein
MQNGLEPADIERINPIMLYSLLTAVRRYEYELYSHLSHKYHLDAERIIGLFQEVEELSPAQLRLILAELRQTRSYQDIVFLAGRNAFLHWCEVTGQRYDRPGGGGHRFRGLCDRALPHFLGLAKFSVMLKGGCTSSTSAIACSLAVRTRCCRNADSIRLRGNGQNPHQRARRWRPAAWPVRTTMRAACSKW